MTREHLKKILDTAFYYSVSDEAFNRLYEPEYFVEPIDLNRFLHLQKKSMRFDYLYHGLEFIEGTISCTGVEFKFRNSWFERISVHIFYDYNKQKIYNSVLALPKYTEADFRGKRTISQRAVKITSDKDLTKYFKRLAYRFECKLIKK